MDYLRFNKHVGWEDYSYDYEEFAKGLDGMTVKEVIEAGFPLDVLLDRNVLNFVKTYGIKNIVEFDQECGNFFSRNNFQMLRIMQPVYMNYANNDHNPETTYFTRSWENHDRPYTREEFYEALRRMIVGGPTDWEYEGIGADYRHITGPFRELNADLFVSDQLPEDIQLAFYTKQLTPQIIIDNQEIIPKLKGKKLSSCFKYLNIIIINSTNSYGSHTNVYDYLEKNFGFDKTMEIIVKYGPLAELVFGNYARYPKTGYIEDFRVDESISYESLIEKMIDKGREIVIKSKIKYDPIMLAPLRDKYPGLFISEIAPQELQDLFYNRELSLDIIEKHPEYMQYIQDIDLENQEVTIGIRPEGIEICEDGCLTINVLQVENIGRDKSIVAKNPFSEKDTVRFIVDSDSKVEEGTTICVKIKTTENETIVKGALIAKGIKRITSNS